MHVESCSSSCCASTRQTACAPGSAGEIESLPGPAVTAWSSAAGWKSASTFGAREPLSIVSEHVGPSLQSLEFGSAFQPAIEKPAAGTGVSSTFVPIANAALHLVGQVIPAGFERTPPHQGGGPGSGAPSSAKFWIVTVSVFVSAVPAGRLVAASYVGEASPSASAAKTPSRSRTTTLRTRRSCADASRSSHRRSFRTLTSPTLPTNYPPSRATSQGAPTRRGRRRLGWRAGA